MDINKKFGYRLAALRSERNMSSKELANIMNVPPTAISHWENGVNFPNNERMLQIADIFNVTLDYLMGRTDNRSSVSIITDHGDEDFDLSGLSNEQRELIKQLIDQMMNPQKYMDKNKDNK